MSRLKIQSNRRGTSFFSVMVPIAMAAFIIGCVAVLMLAWEAYPKTEHDEGYAFEDFECRCEPTCYTKNSPDEFREKVESGSEKVVLII